MTLTEFLGHSSSSPMTAEKVSHNKGSGDSSLFSSDSFAGELLNDAQKTRADHAVAGFLDAVGASDAASIGGNQGQLSMINSAQDINYINADLAKAYGMDASTAYQEALSNTAYQRAVQDAKNAGLNPALMFTSGSSASSFAGSQPRASGSSAKAQSALDISNLGAALGAVAGLIIGKGTGGLYAGREIGNSVGQLVEGLVSLGQNK